MAKEKRRNRQIIIISSTVINSSINGNVVQSVNGVNANLIDKLLVLLEEKDKQIDRLTKLLEQCKIKTIGGREDGN